MRGRARIFFNLFIFFNMSTFILGSRQLLNDDDADDSEEYVDKETSLSSYDSEDNRAKNEAEGGAPKIFPGVKIPDNKRVCLKMAEKFIAFNPIEGRCKNWDCRGSQVTLVNKYIIAILYNNFRKSVATGRCKKFCQGRTVSNMVEMSWQWTLEERARRMATRCPHKRLSMKDQRTDIRGLDTDIQCEVSATSTEVKDVSQYALLTKLQDLLENNEMNDFEDGKYRRGNANYFGCTIVIRNRMSDRTGDGVTVKNSPIGHFLCVFCTKDYNITSTFGTPGSNCPPSTTQNKELCKPDFADIFACQVPIGRVCPNYEAVDWVYELPGTIVKLSYLPIRGRKLLMPFLNTTVLKFDRSPDNNPMYIYTSKLEYDLKPKGLPIKIRPDTPPDRFAYDPMDLVGYNVSIFDQSDGSDWIQSDYNYDEELNRPFKGAVCCWWFFIISLILLTATIVLIIVILHRYNKRAKNK